MRALACVLVLVALLVCTGAASGNLTVMTHEGAKLAYVTHPQQGRALAFSGDRRLVSIGGLIVGRTKLPTQQLTWAPTGERAAYATTEGAVVEWTPQGKRILEPEGWGATYWAGLAWSRDGALAVPRGNELWVIRGTTATRLVGPLAPNVGTGGPDIPEPFAWVGDHVLWWRWPGSGSVAADGIALYEDGVKLGTTLPYADYATACGTHVAYIAGTDRESTDDKWVVFDGRDVSADPAHSWSTPACTRSGRLVAAASRNDPNAFRFPHRSLWQLLPSRRRLTHPPRGWSDEDPRFLPNGSLLFVRSRITSRRDGNTWLDTEQGQVMELSRGKLARITTIGYRDLDEQKEYLGPYYGHFDWSAVSAIAS